ncbi:MULTISPECIES: hypothetical protein [Aquitalea]|uniref:Uncharacterized protein n=1 Tax=Aquitalea magnusonii TaxID=332411 RepID=A0A318K8J3_9NEIS|nr:MULTISPECIES: hypothetical protein [Aquitalea]PXX50988.1 hypothetical protein DFR38_10143 [Aquitalea magnusonii]
MTEDQIKCCWCDKVSSRAQLTGPAANLCPHCEEPVLPSTFGELELGQDFACSLGGSWKKISDSKAEMHDAAPSDKPCEFKPAEVVYPF